MTLKDRDDGFGLLIGDDPKTGRPQFYYGERGLVTIAPPRVGKTQCHMLPNLMTWRGPAIVLDIKGELWEQTSQRRSAFGPVYRIDLDDGESSDCYNPLDFISDNADEAWGDAQTFASLLHLQQSGSSGDGGKFYDLAAPQYIAAIACFVALNEPPHRRNFDRLLDYVSAPLDGFANLAIKQTLPGLRRAAELLKVSDKDTKGNVIWTANNCLIPWHDPQTAKICRVSDWQPAMIRDHNATLYICLSNEKIRTHRALVRLVVGQHLRAFMKKRVDRDVPLVQFFLDEVPQLGSMDVLPQAIDVGGSYRIRVWMIMQAQAQLEDAYGKGRAQGLIAACGLQAYMNPSMEDGLAQRLSDQIGHHDHKFDQSKRPIVTPQTLAGPGRAGDIVAFDDGKYRQLRKHMYKGDRSLTRHEGASP